MAFSDSAFGAVVTCKCPRCRKADMFTNKNPYIFNEMAKMPKHCPNCGLKLEPETGFYYGSMYLSYAIGVFSSLLFFAIFWLWHTNNICLHYRSRTLAFRFSVFVSIFPCTMVEFICEQASRYLISVERNRFQF